MSPLNESQLATFKHGLLIRLNLQRLNIIDLLITLPSSDCTKTEKELALFSCEDLILISKDIDLKALKDKIKSLKKIDAALSNLHLGMFGLCSDCEEEIELERLKEDATQQRCQHCAEKYNKQHFKQYLL
ncbi:dnaK suppressor [Psychromonas sp. CNPT3]|uniref:TraR/DksA family transcriptional regulator n=1 Tax=Psychromonas sp. CNPT3 TaxID=314282 RepID=UPI00006E9A4E|nr:TraR/DksA C4-type zinc finger protein [Psychromonas sp. CNPT3]AGH81129.1 dnaK suppressor [Psychromonas sp. CNPT3]